MAWLEDARTRFTWVSAQPTGVANLQTGLTIMLDRCGNRDDARGLGQVSTMPCRGAVPCRAVHAKPLTAVCVVVRNVSLPACTHVWRLACGILTKVVVARLQGVTDARPTTLRFEAMVETLRSGSTEAAFGPPYVLT